MTLSHTRQLVRNEIVPNQVIIDYLSPVEVQTRERYWSYESSVASSVQILDLRVRRETIAIVMAALLAPSCFLWSLKP